MSLYETSTRKIGGLMILRLDKIDKSFGERKILNKISYDFNEGQIYLIKGGVRKWQDNFSRNMRRSTKVR